jgi:chaperone required for assembly of F1-ATPase
MSDKPYEARPPLKGVDRPGNQVRRFWKEVGVGSFDGQYAVLLDGKALLTPQKKPVILPKSGLADLVASEWQAVLDLVEPSQMPFSRLGFSAIDQLDDRQEETLFEAISYYETDLLAYPSHYPEALKAAEQAHWRPVIDYIMQELKVDFETSKTLDARHVSDLDRRKIMNFMQELDVFTRTGFMMSLSHLGSWALAFSLYKGFFSPQEAFDAATVGERFQARTWGLDPEVKAKTHYALKELIAIELWYRAAA